MPSPPETAKIAPGPAALEQPPSRASDAQRMHFKPSSRHIPALDGLRGLAVLSVFLYHYGGGRRSSHLAVRAVGVLCSWGQSGVTLFFLLSGFLITGLLWDAKGDARWFRDFYIRRALRILPLYYGTLVLLLVFPLFYRGLAFHGAARVAAVMALYLQNVPYFTRMWRQVPTPFWLEHYWTLAVEEQFYLLWPMLLFLTRNLRQAVVLCLSIFLFSGVFDLVNQFAAADPTALEHSLPARAGELALGGAFALAFRTRQWERVRRASQWAACLAAAALVVERALPATPMRSAVLVSTLGLTASIALGGVLTSMLQPGLLQRLGSLAWLRWLGKISFGVYIFHLLPVLGYNRLTQQLTGHTDDNFFYTVRFFVAAGITVPLAWLSFQFYEKPFLRMKARLAPHRP